MHFCRLASTFPWCESHHKSSPTLEFFFSFLFLFLHHRMGSSSSRGHGNLLLSCHICLDSYNLLFTYCLQHSALRENKKDNIHYLRIWTKKNDSSKIFLLLTRSSRPESKSLLIWPPSSPSGSFKSSRTSPFSSMRDRKWSSDTFINWKDKNSLESANKRDRKGKDGEKLPGSQIAWQLALPCYGWKGKYLHTSYWWTDPDQQDGP